MSKICNLIDELVRYGIDKELIEKDDIIYITNRLLEFFKVDEYNPSDDRGSRALAEILDDMTNYAIETGLLTNDTITYRDLYDTAIMGLITPPPSAVRSKFKTLYNS